MKVRCQGMPETHAARVLGEKPPYDDERYTDTICAECQAVILREVGVDEETIREAVAECREAEARLRTVRSDVDGIPSRV